MVNLYNIRATDVLISTNSEEEFAAVNIYDNLISANQRAQHHRQRFKRDVPRLIGS